MRILDQNRPYAEVCGLPGAMYEQNGVLFKGNGKEAFPDDVEHILDDVQPDIEETPLYVSCVEQASETPVVHIEESRDLENMHWRHLKALVEVYGETWENKEKAIAFLKGKA